MKRRFTFIETLIAAVLILIVIAMCAGCLNVEMENSEPHQWEVLCYSETGRITIADTLEGRISQTVGAIKYYEPTSAIINEVDAIYTGNCRARKIEKVTVF